MSNDNRTRLSLRYKPGAVSNDDLAAEISSILEELRNPDAPLAHSASDLGVAPDGFNGADVLVDQRGKGFGPDVILLITVLAPAENYILRSVWDNIILPRLKSRLGADAVGTEVLESDDHDGAE